MPTPRTTLRPAHARREKSGGGKAGGRAATPRNQAPFSQGGNHLLGAANERRKLCLTDVPVSKRAWSWGRGGVAAGEGFGDGEGAGRRGLAVLRVIGELTSGCALREGGGASGPTSSRLPACLGAEGAV